MNTTLTLFFAALAASLLFVASLACHEAGHAFAARIFRLPVRRVIAGNGPWLLRLWGGRFEVRLLGFNGACEFARPLESEPPHARFWIAIAGPIASFIAAALFLALAFTLDALGAHGAGLVFFVMAQANVALAAFNLLPVPPLDGWRALEAVLEHFGVLRLSDASRARLHGAGLMLLAVGTVAFFAAHWGLAG